MLLYYYSYVEANISSISTERLSTTSSLKLSNKISDPPCVTYHFNHKGSCCSVRSCHSRSYSTCTFIPRSMGPLLPPNPTYQSLRSALDKCIVFHHRNPLVSVLALHPVHVRVTLYVFDQFTICLFPTLLPLLLLHYLIQFKLTLSFFIWLGG